MLTILCLMMATSSIHLLWSFQNKDKFLSKLAYSIGILALLLMFRNLYYFREIFIAWYSGVFDEQRNEIELRFFALALMVESMFLVAPALLAIHKKLPRVISPFIFIFLASFSSFMLICLYQAGFN